MESRNFLETTTLKLFIFVLSIFNNAIFFAPILLSACFIMFSFIIFFQDKSILESIFFVNFFKNGTYTERDIIVAYSKYAFFTSLAVTFIEVILNKKIIISAKKRFVLLAGSFIVGYFLLLILFIYFFGFTFQVSFILFILLLTTIFFIFINSLIVFLINQLSKLR